MSDKRKINAGERMEEYARDHGTYNQEKNSYVITEKHAQFDFELPEGFFELKVASTPNGIVVYSGFNKKKLDEFLSGFSVNEEELNDMFRPIRDAADNVVVAFSKRLNEKLNDEILSILKKFDPGLIKKLLESLDKN